MRRLTQSRCRSKKLEAVVGVVADRLESVEAKVDAAISPQPPDPYEPTKAKVQLVRKNSKTQPIRDKQQVQPEKHSSGNLPSKPSRQPEKPQPSRQNVQSLRSYPEPYEHQITGYVPDPRVAPYDPRVPAYYYDPRALPGPSYYEYSRPTSAPPGRRRGAPPPPPQATIWYDHYEHPYVVPQAHVPYPGQPVFIE